MELIKCKAFARAGLIGNPSDGYNGKTISFVVGDYYAEAILYEWERVEIVPSQEDQSRFDSINDLVRDVELHGYYGGIRLVKATLKRFVDYCRRHNLALHDRNFSIRYFSNIPRQVGMAGSSAIIIAVLRALMEFYQVDIPIEVQPSLVLSIETDEIGIRGGLQDRVIQVYNGLVYMDFAKEKMVEQKGYTHGEYERLDPNLLSNVYVAYSTAVGEPTEVFHNPLWMRYNQGDQQVVSAMDQFAGFAADARTALMNQDHPRLHELLDANFDLRRAISPLSPDHVRMIETARSAGGSAKYAGSGGAIVGTFPDDSVYQQLREKLGAIGCHVFRPAIVG